mmetsp:Transcript_12912/g.23212  ORF Transcript_12912/g.23212 Transcript_12912/m.23212 type:complete len:381 (-) Transcript_12912:42-1184(-)
MVCAGFIGVGNSGSCVSFDKTTRFTCCCSRQQFRLNQRRIHRSIRMVVEKESNTMKLYQDDIPDVLRSILERKVVEVQALKDELSSNPEHPLHSVIANKGQYTRSKSFINALRKREGTLSVIAEIKRKSPSKGHIGDIKNPADLSRLYYNGGAACISVLTDFEGFGGTLDDLRKVVNAQKVYANEYPPPCPVLRKDFTIDELQIAEAKEAGASAVLLIVAALGERTKELLEAAHAYGLDALVEVHEDSELEIAIACGAELIGVNNRNLRTFEVSLENAEKMRAKMPKGVVIVAESGIHGALDAWKLRDMGYNAILVGEALVIASEASGLGRSVYRSGMNEAMGLIRAFSSKASYEFASPSEAAFYGADEGAKESFGAIDL